MTTAIRTSTLKIGENRGVPRIWVEGTYLNSAGFYAGMKITANYDNDNGQIVLELDANGDRVVSSSRKSNRAPILDINNEEIRRIFADAQYVQVETSVGKIVITPAKTERKRASRVKDGTVGSIFSGGGLLDEAAKQAGYKTAFGVEWNPDYGDIWQANHNGHLYQGCISQIDYRTLPKVDLFLGGIPCEPFSLVRRQEGNKRRSAEDIPENHELGDMSVWALMMIEATNPSTIVLEETPQYIASGIGTVLLSSLRRMGYNVEWRIINGTEYGGVTTRQRVVIVAKDGAINWPTACESQRTMAEILLPADHSECEWFNYETKSWLFTHWAEQTAKGNSFASGQITPDTKSVQAITKRYFAGQGGNPVVKDVRPGREGWFRWLTLTEVRRIMGLKDTYNLGTTLTTAGEVMGQGVLVDVFRQIIESVAPRTVKYVRRAAA